ncbi:bifunctional riboflavin kinase/FAD synthetase [Salirhabdus sp. Marseille-P4669]|uniref:bifunctional riboflavin kinase/FAD synthetase n=1 Tax=Salirhabdus sp. Marseille-P4669 TaxID=2042310 RepID=UPI000C7CDD0F|nr:bifunctional riboflavin kinase/FAD synthetase [Salirhabdus sp. Marseille-P4669]
MKTIYIEHPHNLKKADIKETALAIGYFDGIHKGHQEVILTAKNAADEKGFQSGVMTFHPHPSVVLNKKIQHVQYITPLEDKLEQLEKLGIDCVYVVKFTESFSNLEPEEFVQQFLIDLNVKHVVAGFDFSYGKRGSGNMDSMVEHARGLFTITTVEKIEKDGEKVSSTRIRKELQNGNVGEVQRLLGRPYHVKGKVITGYQRGRTIGFPTANIAVKDEYLVPQIGVYAVRVTIQDKQYYGMASIGYNPTFENEHKKPSVEVNIFDFNGNIYDEEIKLELYEYMREEKKFSGIEELKEALRQDEENIRSYFSTTII